MLSRSIEVSSTPSAFEMACLLSSRHHLGHVTHSTQICNDFADFWRFHFTWVHPATNERAFILMPSLLLGMGNARA